MVELVEETAQTKSIALSLAGWSGHRAVQHVDVHLAAKDAPQLMPSGMKGRSVAVDEWSS